MLNHRPLVLVMLGLPWRAQLMRSLVLAIAFLRRAPRTMATQTIGSPRYNWLTSRGKLLLDDDAIALNLANRNAH